MRQRWLVLLVGLIFIVNPSSVSACSCMSLTKAQMVENASLIFTGTVTSAGSFRSFPVGAGCYRTGDPVSVTFAVEAVYRGEAPRSVTLTTTSNQASCGYEFVSGKRYTVFASSAAGQLETNLCRGNAEGAIAPAEYGLGAGRPPS